MNASPITWLDGKRTNALPLPDRGLDFGDGLFETLLFHQGKPLYLALHLERMQRGLSALGMGDCASAVEAGIAEAAADHELRRWQWASVRVTVTRGIGPRGYTPPENPAPRVIVMAYSLSQGAGQMRNPVQLAVAKVRLSSQPALAGLKHLNRLEQVLAAQEARALAVDDVVMLAQSGEVVSVTAGNLFAVRGSVLSTPPIVDCGVAGTRRRLIIEKWGAELGLDVSVAPLSYADVCEADEVFYSNSLVTVRSVARLDDSAYSSYAVAQALFARFVKSLS